MKNKILFCGLFFTVCAYSQLEQQYERALRRYEAFEKEYRELEQSYLELKNRFSLLPNVVQGRLTLVSATPVPSTDTANGQFIYFTPYQGNKISLYHNGNWRIHSFSELSLDLNSVQATTVPSTNYDVFIYRQSSTVIALELGPAWASATARSVALSLQDGIYVLSTDATRRYLGTIRTNTSNNPERITDSILSRNIWNYYNRVPRVLRTVATVNTWNYNANAWRQAGAAATNDVELLVGLNEVLVRATVKSNGISGAAALRNASVGIGLDSATTNSASLLGAAGNGSGTTQVQMWAEYRGYPGIGLHTLYWIESVPSAANVNLWGDNGNALRTQSGIIVQYEG